MMAAPHRPIRVATYNIHKCRGLDGRTRPARIAEVLRELDADVIALQEVVCHDNGRPEDHQARFLAERLEMHFAFGENRGHLGGRYGNALLSRFPLRGWRNYDISARGRERRGCLRADVELPGGAVLHVFNVHLGTAFLERRHQARRLLSGEILHSAGLSGPRVILGDFNEWTRGLASRLLRDSFRHPEPRAHLGRSRTYPGLLPLLHLDHVYFDSALRLHRFALHRNRRALLASDHLPLVADLLLSPAARPGTTLIPGTLFPDPLLVPVAGD